MPILMNLSSLHSISKMFIATISRFAEIRACDPSGVFNCCPGFFSHSSHCLAIGWLFRNQEQTLIDPYKLGKKTTTEFIRELRGFFPFLEQTAAPRLQVLLEEVKANYKDYLCSETEEIVTEDSYKDALMEDAWNRLLYITPEQEQALQQLLQNLQEPIYLIANTNELNMHWLLTQFKKIAPDFSWNSGIDISTIQDRRPVPLGPNLYLCPSYRYGCWKYSKPGQDNIIDAVIASERLDPNQLTVVSPVPGDLQYVREAHHITESQLKKPEEFFSGQYSLRKNQ